MITCALFEYLEYLTVALSYQVYLHYTLCPFPLTCILLATMDKEVIP